MAQGHTFGTSAEQMAVDYLIRNGYKIMARNYRYARAEVDIIARKENTLVAVEVKARASDYFGSPQDFVTPKKIKLLVKAVHHYVIEKDLDVEVRFDIIAITGKGHAVKLVHLEDAFFHF